ncbi:MULTISPECIES: hypothetical protein [unclassified Oceanobacillus]
MRVAYIDDEQLALSYLKRQLVKIAGVEVIVQSLTRWKGKVYFTRRTG